MVLIWQMQHALNMILIIIRIKAKPSVLTVKTAGRSLDGSEVIIPIIEPLQNILKEIAAPPSRDGYVFPNILKGVETEEERRKYTSQENSNIKDRVIKICHEALKWDKSICPSGTWCRHSFYNKSA